MGWKHYQTIDTPKIEPQVVKGLFGVHLLIHLKSSTFRIFLNLTHAFKKTSLSENAQKFTQNRQTVVTGNKQKDLALLET